MNKNKYYQSKFEYYRTINTCMIIAVSILSIGYYLSDCYLFGKFELTTLIPRFSILLPFTIFMILNHKTNSFRIMVPMSYFVAHCVMWCTIWACYFLDDLRFACVGFIIINFIFLVLGIAAPLKLAFIAHGLLFLDISIAEPFIHYPDFAMMFLLGIPLYMGIFIFDVIIEKTYRDQMDMKLKLEDHLRHDVLTGAYNRNIISSLTDEKHLFKNTTNTPIAIAIYDLDKFKLINDTYGHTAGDDVLIGVTNAVRSILHPNELLIRWGGEEFVVIMKESCGNFIEHADAFRKAVENTKFAIGKVTISVGVAVYDGGDYQKTIQNADTALYEAKNNGRNQVVMYND